MTIELVKTKDAVLVAKMNWRLIGMKNTEIT
jgi:hypothetical protein